MSAEKQNKECCSMWGKMLKNGFWVIYPLMGICLLHVLWLMNSRMDQIMYNSVPIVEHKAPWKDIAVSKEGRVEKGLDLALIKSPSEEMLSAGKKLYTTTCATCHGQDGKAAIGGARDYSAKEGWKNGREFSGMFKTLQHGIPGTTMGAYDTVSVAERIGAIHYIRNMIGDYPEITDEEIKKVDEEYKLSKDSVTPHQIPILLAKQLLVEEAQETNKSLGLVIKKLEKLNSAGAIQLRELSDDLEKTVTSLHSSKIWAKDVDSFLKFVAVNMSSNGFKPRVLQLSRKESTELFDFLKGL